AVAAANRGSGDWFDLRSNECTDRPAIWGCMMNLPPALTWLHLFERATKCVCDESVPSYLLAMLDRRQSAVTSAGAAAPPRMMITSNKSWEDLVNIAGYAGVAAINSPRVTTRQLEAAGFKYARRFAVVPNLQNARWFVALDGGRVAAASFSVYTPARRSAHVKKWLARLAARLRMPGWYGDQIVIASRQ